MPTLNLKYSPTGMQGCHTREKYRDETVLSSGIMHGTYQIEAGPVEPSHKLHRQIKGNGKEMEEEKRGR